MEQQKYLDNNNRAGRWFARYKCMFGAPCVLLVKRQCRFAVIPELSRLCRTDGNALCAWFVTTAEALAHGTCSEAHQQPRSLFFLGIHRRTERTWQQNERQATENKPVSNNIVIVFFFFFLFFKRKGQECHTFVFNSQAVRLRFAKLSQSW